MCKVFDLGPKEVGKMGKKIASIFLLMFSSCPFVSIEKPLAVDLDNEKIARSRKDED